MCKQPQCIVMEGLLGLTFEGDLHNLYALCALSVDAYGTTYHAWKIKCWQRGAIVMPLAEAEKLI
jgi:hypothetical protein